MSESHRKKTSLVLESPNIRSKKRKAKTNKSGMKTTFHIKPKKGEREGKLKIVHNERFICVGYFSSSNFVMEFRFLEVKTKLWERHHFSAPAEEVS